MSAYTVVVGQGVEIQLDERSYAFDLDVVVDGRVRTIAYSMSPSEVIRVAARLLGPLYYFHDFPEVILRELAEELRKGGFR